MPRICQLTGDINASNSSDDRKSGPALRIPQEDRNFRFAATDSEAASRILLCSNAAETAEGLQRVVAAGLRPTVRSGNHCYEDFVVNNPHGAIIDLSLHNTIDSAPSGHPIRIAPGATLGEVYATLYKHYLLTIPAGTCASVGAGGHISGGGYGLLSRLYGLTCDWITGVDILTVDANGKVVERQTDKLHNPDLFRACAAPEAATSALLPTFTSTSCRRPHARSPRPLCPFPGRRSTRLSSRNSSPSMATIGKAAPRTLTPGACSPSWTSPPPTAARAGSVWASRSAIRTEQHPTCPFCTNSATGSPN